MLKLKVLQKKMKMMRELSNKNRKLLSINLSSNLEDIILKESLESRNLVTPLSL
jgi:hypothetical protein